MKHIYNLRRALWYWNQFGSKKIIYSAGIPRSGSTLLFNILRVVLEMEYKDHVSSCWIEEIDKKSVNKINLIKTHHLNKIDMLRANRTFYTYRDIRDVLVSRLKMFDREPTIEIVRYHIQLHQLVERMGCHTVKYETMITFVEGTIHDVANVLGLKVDPLAVMKKLPSPKKSKAPDNGHDKDTLLHEGHVTGTKNREWEDVLPKELQKQIHSEFEWWFQKYGYPTS